MSSLLPAFGILLVTTIVAKFLRWFLWFRSYRAFFDSLPGEPDFSFIWGNFHHVIGKTSEEVITYFNGLMLKHPNFYRFWEGPFKATVSLHHPETVCSILKTSEPKPEVYNLALPWLGEGLILANGERWFRSRRLLTPAFHFDILKPYVAINNRAADLLLCTMSYKDDIQLKGDKHLYVRAVKELSQLWYERVRNPFLYNDILYRLSPSGRRFLRQCEIVHALSENVISQRREQLVRSRGATQEETSRLLGHSSDGQGQDGSTGQGLTLLEIRNEVDTFTFAGHDSTASLVSWTLYSLAQHPKYQQKIQAEVDRVLQGRDSGDVEWDDLPKLEYLGQVVKEGMRLHCPVPLIQRKLTRPVTIEGVILPVGTCCTVNLLDLHHNPKVWPDPWTFNPDNFSPRELAKQRCLRLCAFLRWPKKLHRSAFCDE